MQDCLLSRSCVSGLTGNGDMHPAEGARSPILTSKCLNPKPRNYTDIVLVKLPSFRMLELLKDAPLPLHWCRACPLHHMHNFAGINTAESMSEQGLDESSAFCWQSVEDLAAQYQSRLSL